MKVMSNLMTATLASSVFMMEVNADCATTMSIYGVAAGKDISCHVADNDEAGCDCMKAGNAVFPPGQCGWNLTGNGRVCDSDPSYTQAPTAPTPAPTAPTPAPTSAPTTPCLTLTDAITCEDVGAKASNTNCVCPDDKCIGCGCRGEGLAWFPKNLPGQCVPTPVPTLAPTAPTPSPTLSPPTNPPTPAPPTCATQTEARDCQAAGATLDANDNCVCPSGSTCTGCGCIRDTPTIPYFSKFDVEGECSAPTSTSGIRSVSKAAPMQRVFGSIAFITVVLVLVPGARDTR